MLRMEPKSLGDTIGIARPRMYPKSNRRLHSQAVSRAKLAISTVNKMYNVMDNMPLGLHVVGHDERGAIVLRQKWSRGQVEARFASMPNVINRTQASRSRA
jgi:hypothetical protein